MILSRPGRTNNLLVYPIPIPSQPRQHCSLSICTQEGLSVTRPSALGMSDPVIESQEIKETQEFPRIQNVEGGEEDERGEGSEGDDEKR